MADGPECIGVTATTGTSAGTSGNSTSGFTSMRARAALQQRQHVREDSALLVRLQSASCTLPQLAQEDNVPALVVYRPAARPIWASSQSGSTIAGCWSVHN